MLVGVEVLSKVRVFPGESMLAVNAVPFTLFGMHGENDGLQLHRVWSVQFPPPLDHVAATRFGTSEPAVRRTLFELYVSVQLKPSAWKLVPLENVPVREPKFRMSNVSPVGLNPLAKVMPNNPPSDADPFMLITPNEPAFVPPRNSFKVPLESC